MVTLWQHQKDMVRFARSQPDGQAYANVGVGSGKTLAALVLAGEHSGRKLIIAPKAVMPVYAEDNDRFGLGLNIQLLDKGTSKRKAQQMLDSQPDAVIVVNYETARLLPLDALDFTLAVADESHKLGAYNSKQSIELARLLQHVPRKLAMSGTPYTDGYHKLFGVFRWLSTKHGSERRRIPASTLFGTWTDFLNEFATTYEHNGVRVISGWRNTARLAELIKPYLFYAASDDVLDLPDVVERTYHADLPAKTRRVYDDLASEGAVIFDENTILASHVLTRLIRLQQLVTSGELQDAMTGDTLYFDIAPRLAIFKELLESLGNEPVVVFTRYQRDVELLTDAVQRVTGSAPALLTGAHDTHQAWRDGTHQVLIANIDAGAEGVRLERARHMVFWSVGYSLSRYQQARARIRRAGQHARTVFYHHIVASGTIDETIYSVLNKKSVMESELTKAVLN